MKKWLIVLLLASSTGLFAMEMDVDTQERDDDIVTLSNDATVDRAAFDGIYEHLTALFEECDQEDLDVLYLCTTGEASMNDLSEETLANYKDVLFDKFGHLTTTARVVISAAFKTDSQGYYTLVSLEQLCTDHPQDWSDDTQASISSDESDDDEMGSDTEAFVSDDEDQMIQDSEEEFGPADAAADESDDDDDSSDEDVVDENIAVVYDKNLGTNIIDVNDASDDDSSDEDASDDSAMEEEQSSEEDVAQDSQSGLSRLFRAAVTVS